ncbi:MAG: hypothetical protein AABP62_17055 [Planctomycetota bacterium]
MSRRRSQSSQPINLFAFLDILICTMGALILMLMVVTTRQLRKESLAQVLAEFKNPPPPLMSVESPLSSSSSPSQQIVILAQPEVETEPSEPEPSEPAVDPRETARVERAAALAQRERELNELLAEWRRKTNELAENRDQHANALAQRRRLKDAASRQVATLQNEVQDLEVKLGGLTGELTATSMGDATQKERKLIEQQIAALQKRLKTAQAAAAGGESKFMVVPFDPQSGTSRRPILIECTAEGLRFIPEDVVIRPDDLEGFTPRINPVLAGSNALVSYWTAWNLKQPQPAREPEPYVLMLVRPSGTVAYYVAMRMLATLKQPHGYELIEEDTQLQQPAVDPGAKAACEAAVKRLLAERNQIQKFARSGSGGGGFARGGGSKGDAFRAGGGSGTGKGSSSNRFEVTDVTGGEDEVGSRSWERIENFAGRTPRRKGAGKDQSDLSGTSGSPSSNREPKGEGDEPDADSSSAGRNGRRSDEVGQPVGRRSAVVGRGAEASATQAGREAAGSAPPADSGIERLEGADDSGSAPSPAGGQAGRESKLDIGLGSTGPTPIAVQDRRTKNKSASNKPVEPEQFTRKRWGLSAPDAAIGLEREVCIDVEPGRLVVAGKHAIRMGEGESRQETFERLVTVLDLQARDWGQPPQGFFWKPSLRFVVAKDGNPNYEQARALAERAGLTTSKEYATDSAEKTGRTTTPPASKPARVIRGVTP